MAALFALAGSDRGGGALLMGAIFPDRQETAVERAQGAVPGGSAARGHTCGASARM